MLAFMSCQKDDTTPVVQDFSKLANPLQPNSGDTTYVHIDMYPSEFPDYGYFYSGNIYFSQKAGEDTYFNIKWNISTDTITRFSSIRMPYLYTQWKYSTTIPAPGLTYNTKSVQLVSYSAPLEPKRKFILK